MVNKPMIEEAKIYNEEKKVSKHDAGETAQLQKSKTGPLSYFKCNSIPEWNKDL